MRSHLGQEVTEFVRAPEQSFDLDVSLEAEALAVLFKEKHRLLVPRVLRVADAEALYGFLASQTSWGMTFRGDPELRQRVSPRDYRSFDSAHTREILDIAYSRRSVERSHLFSALELEDVVRSGGEISLLDRFAEFLNSAVFIGFLRTITGTPEIKYVDLVATRYDPWHFYSFHFDRRSDREITGALVFNLSPVWMPQWGGLLRFRDARKQVVDTFFPRFNSMSIFLASEEHSVSMVAPFAGEPRYAIGGQF